MPQKINLDFLDEPQGEATVNLDFLNADPVQAAKDERDRAAREHQAQKYPTLYEQTGDEADKGKPVEKTKPISDAFLAALPLANPALLWNDRVSDPFKRAMTTAGQDVAGALSFLPKILTSPFKTAAESGEARGRLADQAGQAYQQGDYPYAMSRGMLSMVPFLGPAAANMLDESGVDPAKGTGHVIGAATSGPAVAAEVAAARALPGAAASLAKYGVKNAAIDFMNRDMTPAQQIFKAIRPKNQPTGAMSYVEGAEPYMKRGAELTGTPVTDLDTFDKALDASKAELIQQGRGLRGAGSPYTYDTTPVATAIKNGIPRDVEIRQPEVAQAIRDWADETYGGKNMDIDDIDALRKGGNRRDAGFWNKLPNARMNITTNQLVNNIETDALRKVEYDGLESNVGTGEGLKQVNRGIRDILQTQDYVDRRFNVEQRQALQNLPQQIGKLAALGRFGSAAKMLIAHNPTGAGMEALTGMGEIGLTNFLKDLNSTNGQIASAFRRSTATPAPVPINPVTRAGLPPAQSTVQPQTTGSAAPGGMTAQTSWQQPQSIKLPQSPTFGAGQGWAQALRNLFLGSRETGVAQVPGRPYAGTQPAEAAPIDVPFRMVHGGQLEGAPERAALPESTKGRETQPNELAAKKTGETTEEGSTGNARGEARRMKATRASKEAQEDYEEEVNGKVAPDANFYIARDKATGRLKKVFLGPEGAADKFKLKKGGILEENK